MTSATSQTGRASSSSRMPRRLTAQAGAVSGPGQSGARAASVSTRPRISAPSAMPALSVTSDAELAARVRSLRDHGRSRRSRHEHELIGANSRLDALQAVVLNAKLPWLDTWTEARRSIAARYRTAFGDGTARLVAEQPGSQGAYHLAVALVQDRTSVRRRLAEAGIQTQIHYPIPCHRQVPTSASPRGHCRQPRKARARSSRCRCFPT